MTMKQCFGVLLVGFIVAACEPYTHEVVVSTVTVERPVAVVTQNPTVVYDPNKDYMTSVTRSDRVVTGSYGASDMVAPDVIWGPGNYYAKRYSPSVFK
jgi:hypothetical protein